MKRISLLMAVLGLGLALSGCDKCGNFGPFFTSDTKSCSSSESAR